LHGWTENRETNLLNLINPSLEVVYYSTTLSNHCRPDGFTGRFYKECWPVIKDDIMEALRVIQEGDGRKLHLLNSAFLILIPKKPDAVEVKDFRPISLVHSFAKLVTKILANRLAPRLNSLVSTNQSAFVRGRCIHDNFLLV